MARTPYKMKSSPTKKGMFSNFFSSLGKQLQSNKRDVGGEMKDKYSSKAQRADKVAKPGESKYQFDVRTRKARSKKADKYVTKTPKQQAKIDPKSEVKIDPRVGMDRYAYTDAGDSKKIKTPKTSKEVVKKNKYDDLFDVPFNPNLKYDQYDSEGNPIQKKSPYKKGLGSYAKKAKGSRGYKMKRK